MSVGPPIVTSNVVNKRHFTEINQDLSLALAETNHGVQNSHHVGERHALIYCQ